MAGFSGSTGVSKKYVDDAIQQSTAKTANLYAFDMTLSATGSTVVKRLHSQWSTFIEKLKAEFGVPSAAYSVLCGIITFPATGSASAFGTFYVWGVINTANNQGKLYLTQYHADGTYVYQNHGSTADAKLFSGTSVDIT